MQPVGGKNKWQESRAAIALLAFAVIVVFLCTTASEETTRLTESTFLTSSNEKLQKGNWEWWTLRDYVVNHRDSDVVFMGSSQMACALASADVKDRKFPIDLVAHRNSDVGESLIKSTCGIKPSTCTLALGGAMISDQYMIARAVFNEQHKPQLVVLGVNPRDFMDNTLPTISSTETFKLLSPHVPLGPLSAQAYCDTQSWLAWHVKRASTPALTALNNLKTIVLTTASKVLPAEEPHFLEEKGIDLEKLFKMAAADSGGNAESDGSNKAGQNIATNEIAGDVTTNDVAPNDVATNEIATDENGTPLDRAALSKSLKDPNFFKSINTSDAVKPGRCWLGRPNGLFSDNTIEYQKRYKDPNPPIYSAQKIFFANLLAYLKEQKVPVLVVGMPSLWPNRDLLPPQFWSEFKRTLISDCTKYGAEWIDLSEKDDRFTSADYLDLVHLNSTGGVKLLEDVIKTIDSTPRLAATLRDRNLAGKSDDKNL